MTHTTPDPVGAAASWRAIDLRAVVVTAAHTAGRLSPVGGLPQKLAAIVRDPRIRVVVVAAEQGLDFQDAPLNDSRRLDIAAAGPGQVFCLRRVHGPPLYVVKAATLNAAHALLGRLAHEHTLPPPQPPRAPHFTGRTELLAEVLAFLTDPRVTGYLVLRGAMGCGKTAVFAEVVQRLQKQATLLVAFHVIAGLGSSWTCGSVHGTGAGPW